MSKTKLIIIVLLISAIAGGYWYTQQTSTSGSPSGSTKSTLLSRVPADTVVFMGGSETIPFVNPYDNESMKDLQLSIDDQFDQLAQLTEGKDSPAATVLMNLYKDLANHFYSGQMTEINDFAIYSLGVYPVAAWKASDIDSFTNKLNAIENDNNIATRTFTLGNAELREYLIDDSAPVKMYIAINEDIVSVSAMSNNPSMQKLLAGVDLPKQSLANTDKLQDLASNHQLLPFAMGYIDVNLAITSLSNSDDNLLKSTLHEASEGEDMPDFTSEVCFTDAAKIIAKWPRMIFGYRTFDIDSNPIIMDAAMIFEHTNSEFLSAIKGTLGSLPEYSMENDMLSMGFGINIDNIATFLTDFRKDIMSETYQCESLIEMQQKIAQNDPAMIAMGAQMVAGVQGVSVHVTHIDATAFSSGDMTKFEGMVVITANNPNNLILAAGNFYPPLAQMALESNAEAQPLILPMGITAHVSMSDNALILQFGQAEEVSSRIADIHQGKGLSSSLIRSGMDLSAYFKMIEPMMTNALTQAAATSQDTEEIKKMVKLFETLNIKFVYDVNVEDAGIAIKVKTSMNNASN